MDTYLAASYLHGTTAYLFPRYLFITSAQTSWTYLTTSPLVQQQISSFMTTLLLRHSSTLPAALGTRPARHTGNLTVFNGCHWQPLQNKAFSHPPCPWGAVSTPDNRTLYATTFPVRMCLDNLGLATNTALFGTSNGLNHPDTSSPDSPIGITTVSPPSINKHITMLSLKWPFFTCLLQHRHDNQLLLCRHRLAVLVSCCGVDVRQSAVAGSYCRKHALCLEKVV